MTKFTWEVNLGKEGYNFEEEFDETQLEVNELEEDWEDVSITSLLINIHAVSLMIDVIEKNKNKDNQYGQISLYSDEMQDYFDISKLILHDIYKSAQKKLDNEVEYDFVSRFIDLCRDQWDAPYFEEIIKKSEYYLYLDGLRHKNYIRIIESIIASHDVSPERKPYYYFKQMSLEVNREIIGERYEVLKKISYVNKYFPAKDQPLTCQMIINDQEYQYYLETIENAVIHKCNESISHYLSSSSLDDEKFKTSIVEIIKCIRAGKEKGFSKYNKSIDGGKNRKCFGVMEVGNTYYVSLCGPFDVCEKKILSYLNFSESQKTRYENMKKCVNQYIKMHEKFINSVYSEMGLEVKFYPYASSSITKEQTLEESIDNGIVPNTIMSEYSCCERKMIAKSKSMISTNSVCSMFTSMEPCKKCKPAIDELRKVLAINGFYLENGEIKPYH